MPEPIVIAEYDPAWPAVFESLRQPVASALGALALGIEHVGSTSVQGLAAKPIIDIDVVIPSRDDLPAVIEALGRIGYVHEGDKDVPGREAFGAPSGLPTHHLYVCAADSIELARHLAFRDYLCGHPETASAYAELKRGLAARFRDDREGYSNAKTDFVEGVLAEAATS